MAMLSTHRLILSFLLYVVWILSCVPIVSPRMIIYPRGHRESVRRGIPGQSDGRGYTPSRVCTVEDQADWANEILQRLTKYPPLQSAAQISREDIPLETILQSRQWVPTAWSHVQQLIYPSGMARYDRQTAEALHKAVKNSPTEDIAYYARQLMVHGMTNVQREVFIRKASPDVSTEAMSTWSDASMLEYFDHKLRPRIKGDITAIFIHAATLSGWVNGDLNFLTGGQLAWLQEELITSVHPLRPMDLDYSDIEAVRQLPPSLKDTIRRILPYMGEDRLETIINDVREGHVSTVSPEGGIAPRIASGSQRLIMAGEDDTTVSIQ